MIVGSILTGDVSISEYMFIEYPNGQVVNEDMTDEYVYPADIY